MPSDGEVETASNAEKVCGHGDRQANSKDLREMKRIAHFNSQSKRADCSALC